MELGLGQRRGHNTKAHTGQPWNVAGSLPASSPTATSGGSFFARKHESRRKPPHPPIPPPHPTVHRGRDRARATRAERTRNFGRTPPLLFRKERRDTRPREHRAGGGGAGRPAEISPHGTATVRWHQLLATASALELSLPVPLPPSLRSLYTTLSRLAWTSARAAWTRCSSSLSSENPRRSRSCHREATARNRGHASSR